MTVMSDSDIGGGRWQPSLAIDDQVVRWKHAGGATVNIYPPLHQCYRFDVPRDHYVIVLYRSARDFSEERVIGTSSQIDLARTAVLEYFETWRREDARLRSLLSELDHAGCGFPDPEHIVQMTTGSSLSIGQRLFHGMTRVPSQYWTQAGRLAGPAEVADILQRYGLFLEDIVSILGAIVFRYRDPDIGNTGDSTPRLILPVGLRQGPNGISEAFIPHLPGCLVNGKTLGQAITRVQRRAADLIAQRVAAGRELPSQFDMARARGRTDYADVRWLVMEIDCT